MCFKMSIQDLFHLFGSCFYAALHVMYITSFKRCIHTEISIFFRCAGKTELACAIGEVVFWTFAAFVTAGVLAICCLLKLPWLTAV